MIKYQVMVHIKNDMCRDSDDDHLIPRYVVNFKVVGDSLNECFDCLFKKYKKILSENGIDESILANGMTITRIDTNKCPRWKDMYNTKESMQ